MSSVKPSSGAGRGSRSAPLPASGPCPPGAPATTEDTSPPCGSLGENESPVEPRSRSTASSSARETVSGPSGSAVSGSAEHVGSPATTDSSPSTDGAALSTGGSVGGAGERPHKGASGSGTGSARSSNRTKRAAAAAAAAHALPDSVPRASGSGARGAGSMSVSSGSQDAGPSASSGLEGHTPSAFAMYPIASHPLTQATGAGEDTGAQRADLRRRHVSAPLSMDAALSELGMAAPLAAAAAAGMSPASSVGSLLPAKRTRQDVRREANRVNAKKSRMRKKVYLSALLQRLAVVEQQNALFRSYFASYGLPLPPGVAMLDYTGGQGMVPPPPGMGPPGMMLPHGISGPMGQYSGGLPPMDAMSGSSDDED